MLTEQSVGAGWERLASKGSKGVGGRIMVKALQVGHGSQKAE